MTEIRGTKISHLDFRSIKKGDLVYHEGPLLSHFIGSDGNQYFWKWVDANDEVNRWIVFEVNDVSLISFLEKQKTLKELILQNKKRGVFMIDLDDGLIIKKMIHQPVQKISQEYLPPDESFYDAAHYEAYAQELSIKLTQQL